MPRLRVDRDTTEAEIHAAITDLFAASHVIDGKLDGKVERWQRAAQEAARNDIHDEIERLTNIIRTRRATVPA